MMFVRLGLRLWNLRGRRRRNSSHDSRGNLLLVGDITLMRRAAVVGAFASFTVRSKTADSQLWNEPLDTTAIEAAAAAQKCQ